jgi:glycosyltransferase involved in cell wall biosynthesis
MSWSRWSGKKNNSDLLEIHQAVELRLRHLSEWHLITSEYPPQIGGVSDYTYMVGSGLAAAGDSVHVWCPPSAGKTPASKGVTVHKELGGFAPSDFRRTGQLLDQFPAPRRLLVQWVPHGYGYRSMNIAFCLWLWKRAKFNHDKIELMVHEPFLPFREGTLRQDAAAVIHRMMVITLMNAVRQIWTAIPAWESHLRPYGLGRKIEFGWLPIPGTIPEVEDPAAVQSIRMRYAPDGNFLAAHFGTYGRHATETLMDLLPALLGNHSSLSALLLGRGGEALRDNLISRDVRLAGRVHATGQLAASELSIHLSACDLMIQPYFDGVSSRRTSTIVGLSHGRPVVTTTGRLTEALWAESGAVALAQADDADSMLQAIARLITDAGERDRLSMAARSLYDRRFHVRHTIAALRESAIIKSKQVAN